MKYKILNTGQLKNMILLLYIIICIILFSTN